MHIKSILIGEERFASGDLVNHVATGLWPVHFHRRLLYSGRRPTGPWLH
jgi:hypothetical protein